MILPYELWYEILREATFIPREFDVSTTTFRFSGSDEDHLREYRKVLPTRVAIVNVCRIWQHIGTEFLYGSVHFISWKNTVGNIWGQLSLFRMLLGSRPEIGTLVKRLSLPYHPTDQAVIDILRMCPQITIFSSPSRRASPSWWAPTLFHPVLRQLDVTIDGQSWLKFTLALKSLISLEVLYLCAEGGFPIHPSDGSSISLPALRLLELTFYSDFRFTLSSVVAVFDAPRLRALSFLSGSGVVHQLLLPSQLQAITSLKAHNVYSLRAGDLQNLTQVFLTVHSSTILPNLSACIPFHHIERLGLNLLKSPWYLADWASSCERLLAFPLDISAMPKLQVLEISWGARRVTEWDSTALNRSEFAAFFQRMITTFEQRGVQLIEPQIDLLHDSMSIQSIVNSFRGKGRRRLFR